MDSPTQREVAAQRFVIVALIAFAVFVLFLALNALDTTPPPPDLMAHDDTKHTVTYILAGTAEEADITYPSGSGNVSTRVKLPWQTTESLTGDPYVFFAASNLTGSGTIIMEIDKDGSPWQKVTGPDPTDHVSIGEQLSQKAEN